MQDALEYTHLHILGIIKTRWFDYKNRKEKEKREQGCEVRQGAVATTTEGGSNDDNRGKLMSEGMRGATAAEGSSTTQMRQSLHKNETKTF